MSALPPPGLTPAQVSTLEEFLRRGFKFVTLEHVERYLGVEKDNFVALLDVSGATLNLYGQVGYRLGGGIAMLVEGRAGKAFVWHGQSATATPELLSAYAEFKAELKALLEAQ
jgi:hypothetical protein